MKNFIALLLLTIVFFKSYSQDFKKQVLTFTDEKKETVVISEFLVYDKITEEYKPHKVPFKDFYDYKKNPLGIRFFNFGCIKTKKSGFWLGQIDKDSKGHAIFKEPIYGIRAMVLLNAEIIEQRNKNTLLQFFNVYAPSKGCIGDLVDESGNCIKGHNRPDLYAKKVGDAIGLGINDKLIIRDKNGNLDTKLMTLIINEVAKFETGKNCKFTEDNVIKAIKLDFENESLTNFIQKELKFKSYDLLPVFKDSSFKCDFKKVYLIEGTLENGKLHRTMIYLKNNKYFSSIEFIKYCSKLVNRDRSKEFDIKSTVEQNNEDYNRLLITFRDELGYFAIRTVEEINPEDPNKSIAYFLKEEEFSSYNFPTDKECELK